MCIALCASNDGTDELVINFKENEAAAATAKKYNKLRNEWIN